MSEQAEAVRLIAKLLGNRRTPLDELPSLIEGVHRVLAGLGSPKKEDVAVAAPVLAPRAVRAKRAQKSPPEPTPIDAAPAEATPKVLPPILVRRADVINVAPVALASIFAPSPRDTVRGVVQWFDSRTGQGTLRLPGLSRDVPVDAAMLAGFGIPRLFKGQEVEALVVADGETPKVTALHLANAPGTSLTSGGTVRDRHAKQVVVELKREAQRRSAARAEAELLLPPQRAN
jgi:cold shock CspA family protein